MALGLSPLVKARRAHASSVEGVPLVSARAEPFVLFAGRPGAERAADAWFRWFPVAFNLTVWRNGGSISLCTHAFDSRNSLFFGKAAPIPPDHTHLLILPRSASIRMEQQNENTKARKVIAEAIEQGRYISVDAADAVSTFMINGTLDPVRYLNLFHDLILRAAEAAKGAQARIAVFGESVHLLWAQGKAEAAI